MDIALQEKLWWNYIHEDLRELLKQSFLLLDTAKKWRDSFPDIHFHDYSFIVFPAAKAYEGFLKILFLDLGFITKDDFYGKRFRIGKALNPELEKRLRIKIGVYDKLVEFCKDPKLADLLWDTWKDCRNLIFHWFPKEKNVINLEEAQKDLERIIDAIDFAYQDCKIRKRRL